MIGNNDRINELIGKLNLLLKRQELFSQDIDALQKEISHLKKESHSLSSIEETERESSVMEIKMTVSSQSADSLSQSRETQSHLVSAPLQSKHLIKPDSNLEKFIGENLMNKIGIAITILGVAIGVKYAIDHNLISPLARIILGYLVGFGLFSIGIKLKKNYENYSAVLVSGAIAIMYFITLFGYSIYMLFPQNIAFLLMVFFTIFTVVLAIFYDTQIIAHIGLLGAYAVPFLLSDDSDNILILFSYVAIINVGILAISVKKYWKPLYYGSFIITWLIYFSWFLEKFHSAEHFILAFFFVSLFFILFYAILLTYKIFKSDKFNIDDVLLLLANSFIFFGIGFSILKSNVTGVELLGVFAVCNALVHSLVCLLVYNQRGSDFNLLYLVGGLALVFITIAIPVQLNGNWVTLLWGCEAALLFWIGRTKGILFYESIANVVFILTFLSLIQDWSLYDAYILGKPETRIVTLLNINFLSSVFIMASFAFINWMNYNPKYPIQLSVRGEWNKLFAIVIPALFLTVSYFAFRIEIETYWNQLYVDSTKVVNAADRLYTETIQDASLISFKKIWIVNYSLLFFSLLTFINIKKLQNRTLGIVSLVISTLIILEFLLEIVHILEILRGNYLNNTSPVHYPQNWFYIGIRYVSFVFVGMLLLAVYRSLKQDFIKIPSAMATLYFDTVFYLSLLWIISSELVNVFDIFKLAQAIPIGLSILWGVFALVVVAMGLWKKKKHLRIGAIALLGITLCKLFFYDISDFNSLARTIVFLSLGLLLLIISFLYTKYKSIIDGNTSG